MREFDSPGLREMARVLQLSTGSPQEVDLQDSIVQQSIGLNPFLRRGLTPAGSLGLFTATILNEHLGTDTITNDVDPYTPATAFIGNGYPAVVPANLDVWLLAAHAQNVTAPGDFTGGLLGVLSATGAMGWRNEAASIAMVQMYQLFNVEITFGNVVALGINSVGDVIMKGPVRLRRGQDSIRFSTVKTGAGAGSYKAFLTLGVFPAGMGQDGG